MLASSRGSPSRLERASRYPSARFRKPIKVFAAAGGGSYDRLRALRSSSAAIEQVERGHVVVAFDAPVERFAQVIPLGFALLGIGKQFDDNIELATQPLLAHRRHILDLVRNVIDPEGNRAKLIAR